jgi:hypothetical protein
VSGGPEYRAEVRLRCGVCGVLSETLPLDWSSLPGRTLDLDRLVRSLFAGGWLSDRCPAHAGTRGVAPPPPPAVAASPDPLAGLDRRWNHLPVGEPRPATVLAVLDCGERLPAAAGLDRPVGSPVYCGLHHSCRLAGVEPNPEETRVQVRCPAGHDEVWDAADIAAGNPFLCARCWEEHHP